jgi:hypothetical protein
LERNTDPKDSVRIIDELVRLGLLNDSAFSQLHHLGDSISGFKRYCSKVSRFRQNGQNQYLHDCLEAILHSQQQKSQKR